MSDDIFVTVLLPVYNGEKYLREAIESVLNQTHTNFECIIINDGSKDLSAEIIQQYTDNRIIYIEHPTNCHLVYTLNEGIEIAKGKYIIRMDQDDISLPTRFQRLISYMEQNPEIDVCGSYFETFGATSTVIQYPLLHDEIAISFLFFNPFCHPSTIWRVESIRNKGILFDSNYNYAEDYKFFSECALHLKCANIPEVLVKYRIHENQMFYLSPQSYFSTTKKIRTDLLSLLSDDLTEHEINVWEEYAQTNTIVGIEHAMITIILKLVRGNIEKRIFNQALLERKFINIWKNSFLEAKRIRCKEIWLLFTHSLSKKANFTIKQKLAIILKCRFYV